MNVLFEGNTASGKDEWLTPPEIIRALGEFDLDPCAPIVRPWATAKNHYTIEDNGLEQKWFGRVWLNPPYGDEIVHWLRLGAKHGNCIALIFARTDTDAFHQKKNKKAHSLFFIKGRISFYHVTGKKGGAAGAPSVLVAYDEENSKILEQTKMRGKFIKLK